MTHVRKKFCTKLEQQNGANWKCDCPVRCNTNVSVDVENKMLPLSKTVLLYKADQSGYLL